MLGIRLSISAARSAHTVSRGNPLYALEIPASGPTVNTASTEL